MRLILASPVMEKPVAVLFEQLPVVGLMAAVPLAFCVASPPEKRIPNANDDILSCVTTFGFVIWEFVSVAVPTPDVVAQKPVTVPMAASKHGSAVPSFDPEDSFVHVVLASVKSQVLPPSTVVFASGSPFGPGLAVVVVAGTPFGSPKPAHPVSVTVPVNTTSLTQLAWAGAIVPTITTSAVKSTPRRAFCNVIGLSPFDRVRSRTASSAKGEACSSEGRKRGPYGIHRRRPPHRNSPGIPRNADDTDSSRDRRDPFG